MNMYEQAGRLHFLAGLRRSREILDQEIQTIEDELRGLSPLPVKPESLAVTVEPVRAALPEAGSAAVRPVVRSEAFRQAASKRMSEGRRNGTIVPPQNKQEVEKKAKKRLPSSDSVREVDGKLTVYGLADRLDVSHHTVREALQRKGITGRKVVHPTNSGARVYVYPVSVVSKLKSKGRTKPAAAGAVAFNHPRQKGHPGHDAWRQMMSNAHRTHQQDRSEAAAHATQLVNGVAS